MGNDMHCFRDDHELYREVLIARAKAHAKHGVNSIEVIPAADPRWLPILGEELGEVCRALTYDGTGELRAELVDLLAVASAWVDALDRASSAEPERQVGPTCRHCGLSIVPCPAHGEGRDGWIHLTGGGHKCAGRQTEAEPADPKKD